MDDYTDFSTDFGTDPGLYDQPGEAFDSGGLLTGDVAGDAGIGPTTGSDVPLGDPNSEFSVDDLWNLYAGAPGQVGPDAGQLLDWNSNLAGNADGSPISNSSVVYEDGSTVFYADGSYYDKQSGSYYDANGNVLGQGIVAGDPANTAANNGGRGSTGSFGSPSSSGGSSKGSSGGGAATMPKTQQSLGSTLAGLLSKLMSGTQTGQVQTRQLSPNRANVSSTPAQLTFAGVSMTTIVFGGLLLWLAFGRK